MQPLMSIWTKSGYVEHIGQTHCDACRKPIERSGPDVRLTVPIGPNHGACFYFHEACFSVAVMRRAIAAAMERREEQGKDDPLDSEIARLEALLAHAHMLKEKRR